MKWTAADVPDQADRVAVITGASTGIGYETAAVLARHGATVVLAVRDVDKGTQAAARITAASPHAKVALQQLDLTSLASVSAAAAAMPTLRAASDPQVRGGQYYGPGGLAEQRGHPQLVQSARSHDEQLQRWLWAVSEQSTGVTYPVLRVAIAPALKYRSTPAVGWENDIIAKEELHLHTLPAIATPTRCDD